MDFRRIGLTVFGAALLAVLLNTPPARVEATPCAAMNVFSSGTVANPAPVNSNFSNLVACAQNIDNSNIGSAGIFASQVIPGNASQATFGGSQQYSFPAGVLDTGNLQVTGTGVFGSYVAAWSSGASTNGNVAPLYTAAGGTTSNNAHSVIGTCSMVATTSCVVSFTGGVAFTSGSTFSCSGPQITAGSVAGYTFPASTVGGGASVTISALSTTTATFSTVCTGY